jgi:hypothetical protein
MSFEDYNHDGYRDFSIWHLDEGMGTYKIVPFKEHWIVWDGKLKLLNGGHLTNETDIKELVSLRLFSWGKVKNNSLRASLTLGEFLSYTLGGMVFTKIP